MKNLNFDGQLTIWDIKIFQRENLNKKNEGKIQKSEKAVTKSKKKLVELDNKILKKYLDRANRIIKTYEGRFWIELENETIHLTKNGEFDFKTNKFPQAIPYTHEIIFSKYDETTNKLQKEILSKVVLENNVKKVIKRFGDKNFIVITENNVLAINPQGWILDFKGQAKFKENEIVSNREFKKGDLVVIEYNKKKYIGEVYSIYGQNRCTVNVKFANKHTAFFKEKVQLIY